jgi:8-oxo-dGTP pyrophosphatase MutT (NUDIX family)
MVIQMNPVPAKTHSAGGVVLNRQGQVLVVNQRGRSWSLPKGHVEAGEDPLAAARREILEESGVAALTLVKPLGSYERRRIGASGGESGSELKTLTFFLFTTETDSLRPRDPDNPEARWAAPAAAVELLTHPKDKEFLRRILADLAVL